MSEPLLTKRLHISGLTPSITPADLERRLSLFGKVVVMDGFGARDALGDPRKFGFVTMEIGKKELAKCESYLFCSTTFEFCWTLNAFVLPYPRTGFLHI